MPKPLSLEQKMNVDDRCQRFENAWKQASATAARPVLEDFLCEHPLPEFAFLLQELLRLELDYRQKCGEKVNPADYLKRFPQVDPAWLQAEAKQAAYLDCPTRVTIFRTS